MFNSSLINTFFISFNNSTSLPTSKHVFRVLKVVKLNALQCLYISDTIVNLFCLFLFIYDN